MGIKYILKIIIVVFLLLSLITFINSMGLNLNSNNQDKKLLKVITMETMKTSNKSKNLKMNLGEAFCKSNKGFALEKACNKLTKNNCSQTSCCVYTSANKCVSGNISGPTFNSNKKGKTLPIDYYYFQNKCYGPNCP